MKINEDNPNEENKAVARASAMFIGVYVENKKQAEKWGRSFVMERGNRGMHVLTGSY